MRYGCLLLTWDATTDALVVCLSASPRARDPLYESADCYRTRDLDKKRFLVGLTRRGEERRGELEEAELRSARSSIAEVKVKKSKKHMTRGRGRTCWFKLERVQTRHKHQSNTCG